MQNNCNYTMDEDRNIIRTEQMPISGGSYPDIGSNNSDADLIFQNTLPQYYNWTSMSTDFNYSAENGASPSFNVTAPEESNFHEKLMTESQRMERMKEKMDDLELKFQEITKYLRESPPSPKDETKQPISKAWHLQINSELRNHLVRKLMSAILPSSFTVEERIAEKLEAYAKKVENDIYEAANSKSEYYHWLAEKYYKINEEIAERRKRRIIARKL